MATPNPVPAGRLARWRTDRTLAHAVPLGVFLALGALPAMLATRNPALPWWERAPEQWVYPLQTLVGLVLLWLWWSCYRVDRPGPATVAASVAAGLAGIAVWILPCELFHRLGLTEESAGIWKWLGVQARTGSGFDPADAPWPGLALALRFLRMVVVVAVIEEVFWRGLVMRWLARPDGDFWSVPFGTHHPRALLGTTLAVVLVHQPADYAGALVWGLLLYGLAVWRKSLAGCILAHGVANLVLGLYVARSGHYGFW